MRTPLSAKAIPGGVSPFLSAAQLPALVSGASWAQFSLEYLWFHAYRGLGLVLVTCKTLELATIVSKFRFFLAIVAHLASSPVSFPFYLSISTMDHYSSPPIYFISRKFEPIWSMG